MRFLAALMLMLAGAFPATASAEAVKPNVSLTVPHAFYGDTVLATYSGRENPNRQLWVYTQCFINGEWIWGQGDDSEGGGFWIGPFDWTPVWPAGDADCHTRIGWFRDGCFFCGEYRVLAETHFRVDVP